MSTCSVQSRMRPWIAITAAFAVALQMLLAGLADLSAHAAATSADPAFILCSGNGDGASQDHGGSGTVPGHSAFCTLCLPASMGNAILPAPIGLPGLLSQMRLAATAGGQSQVVAHKSPTGRYTRGPPRLFIAIA
jgi:hypothetical protein